MKIKQGRKEKTNRKRDGSATTHQLTTDIANGPGRLLAEPNKSSRMPRDLFASDVSATGSRIG